MIDAASTNFYIMARELRHDYEGAWHHVMNRGARKDRVFLDDNGCLRFFQSLNNTVKRFGLEIHAYALMPNHDHLLVQTPLGNLSRCMQHLNATYTQAFNRRHRLDGSLFRGRYRSKRVIDGTDLKQLIAYIHLNPIHAGLVSSLLYLPVVLSSSAASLEREVSALARRSQSLTAIWAHRRYLDISLMEEGRETKEVAA